MMPQQLQPLESELLEHLRVEFGSRGHRVADLLSDAHSHLTSSTPLFRRCDAVAFCLREAMQEILKSVESGGAGSWRRLSREVIEKRKRYGKAIRPPGDGAEDTEDAEGALCDLLVSIDALEEFLNEGVGPHERRLIKVMERRTGAVPLSDGTEPVHDYQGPSRPSQQGCPW